MAATITREDVTAFLCWGYLGSQLTMLQRTLEAITIKLTLSWHCSISYLISLRLHDAIWGVFSARNTKTHSAHLHLTMATKMGTNREAPHAYTQPEGIGYLVGTVSCGRSNFVNFWTKIWPAEQLKAMNDTPNGQLLTCLRARQRVFFASVVRF